MESIVNFIVDLLEIIETIQFQVGKTSISLAELIQLFFCIIVTFVVANYFSRFLKYRGLRKIIVDQGSRYIIANLVSYGSGFFILLIILQTTGFDISILAVIGGGLGIGIGLGFQDFLTNFISGVTLLTERKIKTGDYIKINDLQGFVQEISTRAIVVRQKNGSSAIIPNRHFVENQIINFHYETNTVRLKLPVGVAYESDTTQVTEVLLICAYIEHNILQFPAPQVVFVGFGSSSLDFELWVWINSNQMGVYDEILSSLRFTIEYKFREHNITIPFPQQVLWLKNSSDEATFSALANQSLKVSKPDAQHTLLEKKNLAETKPFPLSHEPQISIRKALKKVSSFSHLNELRLRQVIEIGRLQSLKPQEILFEEDDPGDAFYIILSGSIEVYSKSLCKKLAVLGAGHFFGEMSLMLGVPRTATVKALEQTLLFAIVHENFKVLLQQHPDFHEAIVQALSNHQEELVKRKQELQEQGWLSPGDQEMNILNWVRERIQLLFSV